MLPSAVRILLCTVPQDMRRSFDGLALAAKEHLGEEVQSGALCVFVGKRPTRVKVLWWDKNGYCLLYKRLHRALFKIPEGEGPRMQLDAKAFAELLAGVAHEKKTNRCNKSLSIRSANRVREGKPMRAHSARHGEIHRGRTEETLGRVGAKRLECNSVFGTERHGP